MFLYWLLHGPRSWYSQSHWNRCPLSWPYSSLLVVALELSKKGRELGGAVFQLTCVYMATLVVNTLKSPLYPLWMPPFSLTVLPNFNRLAIE